MAGFEAFCQADAVRLRHIFAILSDRLLTLIILRKREPILIYSKKCFVVPYCTKVEVIAKLVFAALFDLKRLTAICTSLYNDCLDQ